jgi:hypothetical protein
VSWKFLIVVTVVVVAVPTSATRSLYSILSDRYFDTLQREALAQLGALDDTGELLGGEDLERFTKDGSENGG